MIKNEKNDKYKVSYVRKNTDRRDYVRDKKGTIKYYNKKDAIMTAGRLKGKGKLPHVIKVWKKVKPPKIGDKK